MVNTRVATVSPYSLRFTLSGSLCLCNRTWGLTQLDSVPCEALLHPTVAPPHVPTADQLGGVRLDGGAAACVRGTESEVLRSVTRCLGVPLKMTMALGSHTGPRYLGLRVGHRARSPSRVTTNLSYPRPCGTKSGPRPSSETQSLRLTPRPPVPSPGQVPQPRLLPAQVAPQQSQQPALGRQGARHTGQRRECA